MLNQCNVLFIFLSASLLAVLVFCDPLEPANDPYNVNRHPTTTDPSQYRGEWPNHLYFPSPPDWRKIPMYQLVTDRFSDGNPDNNEGMHGGYDLYRVDFRHGGDFQGLTQKLDYIKSLGFDAIWISPVFQNLFNNYHSYAQVSFTVLDDRFGTLNDFRELTNAAHARGMYIIVDIVVNHMDNLLYFEGHRSDGAPFRMHTGEYRQFYRNESIKYRDFVVDNTYDPNGYYGTVYKDDGYPVSDNSGQRGTYPMSDFHHNGDLNDYGDPWQNHLGKIYGVMDDLRNDHPRVQDKIIAMTKALIASVDIDGIRMDTPMQVPLSFFQRWAPEVRNYARTLGKDNFFIFGEFYCSIARAATMVGRGKSPNNYGQDTYIGSLQVFDGGIHYPMYSWFDNAVKNQNTGHLNEIYSLFKESSYKYDFYVPHKGEWRYSHLHFYNNHDQWRMAAAPDGFLKTDLASAIISFWPGIPLFYAGDEQGFYTNGTALDGWSREDHATSVAWRNIRTVEGKNPADNDNFNMTNPHYIWVAKLNTIRRLYPSLQNCDTVHERWTQTQNSNGIYAFSRVCGGQGDWVLVGFNTWRDRLKAGGELGTFYTGWQQGQVIVNVFNTREKYTLGMNGILNEIWFDGYEVKLFVLENMLRPLDPIVTAIYPYHDMPVTDDSMLSDGITIQFSDDMEEQSVKSAFRINSKQPTTGSLTYDASRRMLIYRDFAQLPDGIHTVELARGVAKSRTTSQSIYGLFSSRFLKGSMNNVLVNPMLGTDQSLLDNYDRQSGRVTIRNKATGAEKMRIRNDDSSMWSPWRPYQAEVQWNVRVGHTRRVSVQYYASGSAAYFVHADVPL